MLHGAGIFTYITGPCQMGKCRQIFQHHGASGCRYYVDMFDVFYDFLRFYQNDDDKIYLDISFTCKFDPVEYGIV